VTPKKPPPSRGFVRRFSSKTVRILDAVANALTGVFLERPSGIRTRTVSLRELGFSDAFRVGHNASFWFTLRRILPRGEVTSSDVFIDFGSGMGRVVFLAARDYPFRKVIGVELVPQLHAAAAANIARTRDRLRCQQIELVNADVLDYRVPDDITVVYFYNPFRGPTFAHVVSELCASLDRNPRKLRVIYFNPREEATLLATGRARLVRRRRGLRPRTHAVCMYVLE
jgi:SAM-dependent methyltransferase